MRKNESDCFVMILFLLYFYFVLVVVVVCLHSAASSRPYEEE